MKRTPFRVQNSFSIDCFITICLLLAGWKYTNGLARVMDLLLYLANRS